MAFLKFPIFVYLNQAREFSGEEEMVVPSLRLERRTNGLCLPATTFAAPVRFRTAEFGLRIEKTV